MKLSIITINRNNAEGLRKTIESVFAQTYRDFEYIVVDGNSTDESVEVIKDYSHRLEIGDWRLENFHWISEPDTGIYNAMNKGLKMAHGEYTLMLNSGDFLVDEYVIERIVPELHDDDIVEGNLIEDFPEGRMRNCGYGKSDINLFEVFDGFFLHQASFIKLEAMKKYGYYDETYKKNADTYFYITALAYGNATFRHVDMDIAYFDLNGISNPSNFAWHKIGDNENLRWTKEHMSRIMLDLCATAPQKIQLYDELSQHKWIWLIVKVLRYISRSLSQQRPKIRKEKL